MSNYFLLQNIVDRVKKEAALGNTNIDTDSVAKEFENFINNNFNDEEFCNLLACSGFIPDLYPSDSSEETLYTKLIEVMVSIWAKRMGYMSKYIKEKASYEDVNIVIANEIIVCDAKSFRLGRSQAAPNVKDFLKLEDIRKWRSRYKNGFGGLVTYPDTHDWTKGSDAYLYCTTKDCPTLMLSYIYLATILHYKMRFNPQELIQLWDYNRLFPHALEKKMEGGNRDPYWNKINSELERILNLQEQVFFAQIHKYKEMQQLFIKQVLSSLDSKKEELINHIQVECNQMDEQEVREELASYKIRQETKELNNFIDRIKKYRL